MCDGNRGEITKNGNTEERTDLNQYILTFTERGFKDWHKEPGVAAGIHSILKTLHEAWNNVISLLRPP